MTAGKVDVCIVCALPEELEAVRRVFQERSKTPFHADAGKQSRNYFRGAVINKRGERLVVHLSCPPRYEGLELALHLKPVLQEFQPPFAAMTGICAGDRRDTHLGDIIIAETAFQYDTGRFVLDERGATVHQRDTRTYHPDQDLLAFVRTFRGWKRSIRHMRPPKSLQMQKEWLLARLAQDLAVSVEQLPAEELSLHAPLWRRIVEGLRREANPLPRGTPKTGQ